MSGLVATVIGNIVTIICCTIFSMHFNNPWLILVALLFYRSYECVENPESEEMHDGSKGSN